MNVRDCNGIGRWHRHCTSPLTHKPRHRRPRLQPQRARIPIPIPPPRCHTPTTLWTYTSNSPRPPRWRPSRTTSLRCTLSPRARHNAPCASNRPRSSCVSLRTRWLRTGGFCRRASIRTPTATFSCTSLRGGCRRWRVWEAVATARVRVRWPSGFEGSVSASA